MGRAHEDVVGDFAKWQSQVDDIILCAAAFREVADMNDSPYGGLSGWKRLKIIIHKIQYLRIHEQCFNKNNFQHLTTKSIKFNIDILYQCSDIQTRIKAKSIFPK